MAVIQTGMRVQVLGTVSNFWKSDQPGQTLQIFTLRQTDGKEARFRTTTVNFEPLKGQMLELDMTVGLYNKRITQDNGKGTLLVELDVQQVYKSTVYNHTLTPVQAAVPGAEAAGAAPAAAAAQK